MLCRIVQGPAAFGTPCRMSSLRPASPLTISAIDWLLLLVLSVLWGGSFYFAKIAVLEIPPLTLALGRVSIAAAALAVVARAIGEPFPRDGATWRWLAVMALFNNAMPFALLFWGQPSASPRFSRPPAPCSGSWWRMC